MSRKSVVSWINRKSDRAVGGLVVGVVGAATLLALIGTGLVIGMTILGILH